MKITRIEIYPVTIPHKIPNSVREGRFTARRPSHHPQGFYGPRNRRVRISDNRSIFADLPHEPGASLCGD
jgi:hypothetical protein